MSRELRAGRGGVVSPGLHAPLIRSEYRDHFLESSGNISADAEVRGYRSTV
jgi:hypothetical protein